MVIALYALAFLIALGVLIVVHELGHYGAARLCGVRVLRFSVGFGRVLVRRQKSAEATEWVLSAFPLGGYVRMLDEREGAVPHHQLGEAFNRKPLHQRAFVVAAGPLSNLLFAVFLYFVLFVHGVDEVRPILAAPPAQSPAFLAGLQEQDLVRTVDDREIRTWSEFRWEVLRAQVDRRDIGIGVESAGGVQVERRLSLVERRGDPVSADSLAELGIKLYRPAMPPVIGRVLPASVAEASGLRNGDRILSINDHLVSSWQEVVAEIGNSAGRPLLLRLSRGGGEVTLSVIPQEVVERGQKAGRIGVAPDLSLIDQSRLVVSVSYGPVDALVKAARQTWETAIFSLSSLWRMVAGDISWKNLSGPVTIADYAGQSARLGLAYYLKFLALISISLGVLNLLPIPVLDGGHLMYYLIEGIKGSPVSQRAMEIGQQVGLALLVSLMAFAFYNDINRLISS